jgi:hypothetical protein
MLPADDRHAAARVRLRLLVGSEVTLFAFALAIAGLALAAGLAIACFVKAFAMRWTPACVPPIDSCSRIP